MEHSRKEVDMAIANAIASVEMEMEGSSISPEVVDIIRAYALGEISEEEAFRQIDEFIEIEYLQKGDVKYPEHEDRLGKSSCTLDGKEQDNYVISKRENDAENCRSKKDCQVGNLSWPL